MRKTKIPHVDEELIRFLKEKFPPTEYKQGDNADTFIYDSIFRAGQRDIISRLEIWYKQQTGGN